LKSNKKYRNSFTLGDVMKAMGKTEKEIETELSNLYKAMMTDFGLNNKDKKGETENEDK